MAPTVIYITAAASAMGLYFLGRNHTTNLQANNTEVRDGSNSIMTQVKKEMQMKPPKLAPQFDGLFCFETFVTH